MTRNRPATFRWATLAAVTTLLAAAVVVEPEVAAASAPASPPADRHVIVLVRSSQPLPAATPDRAKDRRSVAVAAQAAAVSDVRNSAGRVTRQFSVVDGFAATVSDAEAARLASRTDVAAVLPDLAIAPPAPAGGRPPRGSRSVGARPAVAAPTGICTPDPAHPQLNPEALPLMHVASDTASTPEAQQLATGAGVRVGVIGNGVDVDNPDLRRADGSSVVVDYRDFQGTGTDAPVDIGESMGDTASIAAQGIQTYDLGDTGSAPAGCTIRVLGVAPGADVVALKAFDGGGSTDSTIVAAVDYAVTVEHVDVLNESLGGNYYPDTDDTPIALANAAAVESGVTVVAASGDGGAGNTIGEPASGTRGADGILSVGATSQLRNLFQLGYFAPGRSWYDGAPAFFSSTGVAGTGRTLDVVAPGYEGWSLCSTDTTRYVDCPAYSGSAAGLERFSGTSESAPLTAGVAALVIDRYRRTHAGSSPRPQLVKQIITGTADDTGAPADEQGAGQVDALRAVRLAGAVDRTTPPTSSDVLVNPTQLMFSGPQAQSHTASLTVSNPASTPRTVALQTVESRATGTQRLPFRFPNGTIDQAMTFTVAPGTDRITVSAAWPDPTRSSYAFADLFDPAGNVANDAESQGPSNTLKIQAVRPRPGTWTYLIGANFGPITHGTAVVTTFHDVAVGRARPITVPAGGTAQVRPVVPAPSSAGDHVFAARIADASTGRVLTTVPVVVRDEISVTAGVGRFSGDLAGGNGRPGVLAGSDQVFVDVPAGTPALHVAIAFRGPTGQEIAGYLVAPSGDALDRQTTLPPGSTDPAAGQAELDLYAVTPDPGRWEIVLGVDGAVNGTTTRIPYDGTVIAGSAPVTAPGLPTSTATVLTSGSTHTATVHIVNTTAATHAYVLDARTDNEVVRQLLGAPSIAIPPAGQVSTPVLVPPLTDTLTTVLSAPGPIQTVIGVSDLFDDGYTFAPEVYGSSVTGSLAVGTAAPQLSDGPWLVQPAQVGPFPADGSPVTLTTSAATFARFRELDPTTSTATGNPWAASFAQHPTTAPVTPVVLGPGASADVTVTITPRIGRRAVAGTLYVEDWDPVRHVAGEVAALPYAYSVDAPTVTASGPSRQYGPSAYGG